MDFAHSETEASAIEEIHHLLYQALIEIRHEARELQSPSVFGLANLFHVTPLELALAAKGEMSYEDVMQSLVSKARELNCESWIQNVIARSNKETDRPID